MAAIADRPPLISILRLATMWSVVRRPMFRVAAVSTFLTYTIVAMLVGQMLVVMYPATEHVPSFFVILPSGQPWWNFPALLVVTPGFILALPFFSTLAMILVAFGVSLGMTSAVYLGVQLFRHRRTAKSGGTAGAGTLAGLSPALISLVTLGACCSTTAAALAGLAWTAAVTGTTLDALLINNWFPGVFQLVVLYVALLAQEELLRTYAWAAGLPDPVPEGNSAPGETTGNARRIYLGWVVRASLLVGGTTWLLALPAEWTGTTSPALTGPFVFQAVFEHLVPSILAIGAALFPDRILRWLRRGSDRSVAALVPRVTAVVAGASLLTWYPAAIVAHGASGWANELLGAAGGGPAWGGILPPFGGLALAFQWTMQFALLGVFCLGAGIAPRHLWTVLGLSAPLGTVGRDPLSLTGDDLAPDRPGRSRPASDVPEVP